MLMVVQRNYSYISKLKVDSLYILILRMLKIFTSSFGIIIFILVSHFSLALVNFVIITLTNLIHQQLWDLFNLIWLFFSIMFNLILFGVLIIDFVLNIKCKAKKCFKFWLNTDPFYFRIQHLLLFPLTTFTTIVSVIRILSMTDTSVCTITVLGILDMTLYFIEEFFFILYFSGFVLAITYFKKFKSLIVTKKIIDIDAIDEIFSNEYKLDMFREFCDQEFSTENLLLYEAIKKFQSTNKTMRKSIANEIYSKYLNGNLSELEANVPRSMTIKVKSKLDLEFFEYDLFNEILFVVKENLSDTYSRFIISEVSENYELTLKLIKDNTKVNSSFYHSE
jgi:hypothetical protein